MTQIIELTATFREKIMELFICYETVQAGLESELEFDNARAFHSLELKAIKWIDK